MRKVFVRSLLLSFAIILCLLGATMSGNGNGNGDGDSPRFNWKFWKKKTTTAVTGTSATDLRVVIPMDSSTGTSILITSSDDTTGTSAVSTGFVLPQTDTSSTAIYIDKPGPKPVTGTTGTSGTTGTTGTGATSTASTDTTNPGLSYTTITSTR